MPAHEGNEAYRAFMDHLTKSNVDELVDLPTIAAMGDTSSDKSSLLSMISQLKLPSNDKLTTRCPIMLQMHKKDMMSGWVKVVWKGKLNSSKANFDQETVDESNWNDLTGFIAKAEDHIIVEIQKKEVAHDILWA